MRTEAAVVETFNRCLRPAQRNENEMMNVSQNPTVANMGIHPSSSHLSFTIPTSTIQVTMNNPSAAPTSNLNLTVLSAPGVERPSAVAGPAAVESRQSQSNRLSCVPDAAVAPHAPASNPRIQPVVVENFSSLNRSDFAEVKRNRPLIDPTESSYLGKVERKVELFDQRFREPDQYLSNSAILLLSTGWSSAKKYAHCCMPGGCNRSGACRLHKYCPYCSWYAGNMAKKTYVPAFDSGNWHWLTGSWNGDLDYDGGTAAAHGWVDYWNAYKAAFNEWVEGSTIRGIFWVEELAVNSLCPTHVLPHVHAIVDADVITEEELERLAGSVKKHLVRDVGPDCLEANLHVKPIATEACLYGCLGYMFKPLDLVTPYRKVWRTACAEDRTHAQQINNAVSDLVLGFSQATQDRNKITGKGTLNPRDGRFIGIGKKDRRKFKALLRRVAQEAAEEQSRFWGEQEEEMSLAA